MDKRVVGRDLDWEVLSIGDGRLDRLKDRYEDPGWILEEVKNGINAIEDLSA